MGSEEWRAWNYQVRYDHQISGNHSFAVRHLRELSPERDVVASSLRTVQALSANDDDEWMIIGTPLASSAQPGQHVPDDAERGAVRRRGRPVDRQRRRIPHRRHAYLAPGYYHNSFQDLIDTTSGGRDDFQWQFTNTTSWFVPDKMGDHDFKFGVTWNMNTIEDFNEDHLGGEFRMASDLPFDIDTPFTYPDRLRIRVGDPTGRFLEYPGDALEVFFQDKWTLNDRWTLGLGSGMTPSDAWKPDDQSADAPG